MAYLEINFLLLVAAGLALLAVGYGMVAWELAARRSGRPFFKTRFTRQNYWLTYFCAFVLGAALLLKAAVG